MHLPPMTPEQSYEAHSPVLGVVGALIERGQASGDFDPEASSTWLQAVTMALVHAAAEEVRAGRMTAGEAAAQLRRSVLAALGAPAAR
jgi:hypothetical protein